ncbi:MAG: hypothetical protein NC311_07820 [Muribaculaceae bacterium]|nr:hypothetical protein [Muribaculaceae bacterium]
MIKKYHPNWIIAALIAIGIGSLAVCVIGGIWLSHGLGVAFKNWGACPDYFSDFLGGALGLTVGFVLDKFCIEKINHVFEYKKLMEIVKNELTNIKNVVYTKTESTEIYLLRTKNIINADGKLQIEIEEYKEGDGEKQHNKVIENVLYDNLTQSIPDVPTIMQNYLLFTLYNECPISEFIFDNVVKTAETVSVFSNLPFAKKYSKNLITCLSLIQKYIERCNTYKGDEQKIAWLLLQYYINQVMEVL